MWENVANKLAFAVASQNHNFADTIVVDPMI